VRVGRPRSLTPHQRQEAVQRLADGEVQADLARSYGVSQATISRLSGDRPFEASAAGAQLSAEGRRGSSTPLPA
jgi:transposase-like protein